MRGAHEVVRTVALAVLIVSVCVVPDSLKAEAIRGSQTYRPEVTGRFGVVAAGRHFAAEAGMRMFARGGNAVRPRRQAGREPHCRREARAISWD